MTNKIEDIKEALHKPAIIKTSVNDDRVKYYYQFKKELRMFIMVVVKYLNGHGFVITAYLTKTL